MFSVSQINCLYCNNRIAFNRTVRRRESHTTLGLPGIAKYNHSSEEEITVIYTTTIDCDFCEKKYKLYRDVDIMRFELRFDKIFIEVCKKYGINNIEDLLQNSSREIAEPINNPHVKLFKKLIKGNEKIIHVFFTYQGREGYIVAKSIPKESLIELRDIRWL